MSAEEERDMAARWNEAYARFYPEHRFGGYAHRDGAVAFHCRVQSLLQPDFIVCDFGCGRGFHKDLFRGYAHDLQVLKGKVARVIGVDVDVYGADNPYIDEFRQIQLPDGRLPLQDGSVDLVVTEWVVEHLPDPGHSFDEIRRVLKPGGYVCIRTPNLWHYSCLGALLIPDRLHYKVRQLLDQPHESTDVFPTLYRCNTLGRMRRALGARGFQAHVHRHQGPSHFVEMGGLLALLGEVMERISPPVLYHELHAFARKLPVDSSGT